MRAGALLRPVRHVTGAAGATAGLLAATADAAIQVGGRTTAGLTRLPVTVARAAVAAAPVAVGTAPSPGRLAADVVDGVARAGADVTSRLAHAPAQTVSTAGQVARRGVSAVRAAPRQAAAMARAELDLHPQRTHRRVWQRRGHAQIEVRGATGAGPQSRRVSRAVKRAVSGVGGVRWAEVNAVTGQVLVAFDERRVDVGTLLETVRAVEEAQGTREDDFSWRKPVHPSDSTPVGAAMVELAADYVAFSTAVTGRLLRLPALPRGIRIGLTLLDQQPQLRRRLSARIGPTSTDVVMSLTYAAVLGLSQRPIGPALDAVYRAELLAEVLARRSVWNRREPELHVTPEALPREAPDPGPRPSPLPKGPLETWVEQLGPGSFLGALGVLALTREPRRAGDAVLAAVPRAARHGRESFAATAARRLARRGIIPMDPGAYRRLDRISAIVVDSSVLCTQRPQILTVDAERGDLGTVWRGANRLLRDQTMEALTDGHRLTGSGLRLERDPRVKRPPPGGLPLVLRQGNRRLGRLTVGGELSPLAEALVDAARATGARVLLTEHAVAVDLLPRGDETLSARDPLSGHVRRLQREGHGVMCLSATDDAALAAADVGVGILGDQTRTCWSAALLCGPGLQDACALLAVTTAARPLSERVVHLAQAATALGTLLALVGGRRPRGRTHALAPVHASAALGLFHGARTARFATRSPRPTPVLHVSWHAMEPSDVLERLTEPARARRSHSGAAALVVRQVRTGARAVAGHTVTRRALAPARGAVALTVAVREELEDPLTPVLTLGAAASAVVGSVVDAALVTAVLGGNAVISGAQRLRAERGLTRLLVEQALPARRLRDGHDVRDAVDAAGRDPEGAADALGGLPFETVPAERLVPGDLIALQPSDVVPADARLLAASGLEVDEASLTGESLPIGKQVEATPGAGLTDRACMVFDGTTVVAGSAYAIVVATGGSTEAGRAARAAGGAASAAGVQARLAEVTRLALPATAWGGAGVAGLGLLRGLPLRESIAAGVSVAVAAVPEGLPLVATMAQAGAARRLSRRGVLVRSSRTLEALGRVDTVCFDKTGTLTEGRLSVARISSPDGDLERDEPAARLCLTVARRACPAVDPDDVAAVPHATDRAVLETAGAADEAWELRAECSFEASRGYSAGLGSSDGTPELAVKGAPEMLLPRCTQVLPADGARALRLTQERRTAAEDVIQRLADAGLRVLAVARRRSRLPEQTDDLDPLVEDLTLVGFLGIADSPRKGAAESVRRMRDAGIWPIMITGDHPATATAIAAEVGLPTEHVVTGADLEGIAEQERVRLISEATVFARVSPEQKVRVVEALRAAGRVVAMTGDGANDAAAIRLADVGIGVGASGSTAARSSADLVLSEPDLPRIHDALVEGRAMWHRMREAVSILVGGNAGEMAFMLVGTALAGRAPINIRQMLLVNLLTDMLPALAVAVAPLRSEEEASQPVESTLGSALARAVVVRGTTTALGGTLAWTVGRYTGRGRRADSMGLAALVGTQLGQTLVVGWRSPLVATTGLVSAVVLFAVVETPGVSQLFGCTPLGPVAWLVVLGSSALGTAAATLAPRLLADGSGPAAAG